MADLSSLAGDISSAGAALAGLILVFLGHTAGTFENYDPSERAKVKDRFRKRATLAFIGFVFALFACLFALIGEWQSEDATLEIFCRCRWWMPSCLLGDCPLRRGTYAVGTYVYRTPSRPSD